MMTTFPVSSISLNQFGKMPITHSSSIPRRNLPSFPNPTRLEFSCHEKKGYFSGGLRGKDGIFVKNDGLNRNKRLVLVRLKKGSGFNGGGDDDGNGKIVGNLVLALGLSYLTFTGQLGWVLDAIVSIWLLVILVPIIGLGVFIWWAGRDIVQDACPNCGNEFQIFKSALTDNLELCPFCSQPFSVVGNEFVSDSVKSSNQSSTFGQAFDDMFPRSKKEKNFSTSIVDIEAEIKDAD